MARVLVWLEGEPLVSFHEKNQPELQALHRPFQRDDPELQQYRQRLAVSRRAVERDLQALGFETQGEVDVVLHALFGRLAEESFPQAAALPGVRAVRRVREFSKLLDGAVPLINAVPAWAILGGEARAGRGMRVGIIDTGVDINHPMLQDPFTAPPPGFPRGQIEFTNNKVIVARNYLSLLDEPRDIANAMDRDGHGTFVAAIAAGRRVIAPRAQIVGVAPGAYVGNYRVFGSPLFDTLTTDTAIIAALNDAVTDGMQVVNLSLGSFVGDLPSADPVAQAVVNTVRAGVVVAAAAGNFPFPGSIDSPSDAPGAISVGASTNARIFAHPLRVTGPGTVPPELARLPAAHSDAPAITAPLGPLPVWPLSTRACDPLTASDRVQDALALIKDGQCTRSTKIRNAASAGAKAVLIYRTDQQDALEMSGLSSAPIPAFQLSQDDGEALRTFWAQAGQLEAVIEPQIASVPVKPDRIALFSSLGPAFDMELKPDLAGPGTIIYSAWQINDALGLFYDPSQFGLGQGTSFSTPFVTGAALLLRQLHPDWTSAQVKSALVNTAANVVKQGAQQAPLVASGNGRLDVAAALRATASLEPVGLSFSSNLLTSPLTVQRTLTITNLADSPESFSLEVKPRSELSNAAITVDPASTATLRSRESAVVRVTFTANPPVDKRAAVDGRIQVRGSSSGLAYTVPYWGELVSEVTDYSVFRVRGNGQTQPVSTKLAENLVASVRDLDLVGLVGAPVKFAVTRGGGRLSVTETVTDFTGYAATSWTLGDLPGINQVQVTAVGVTKTFTATARPNPVFSPSGVVHAASFSSAVAPGSIVSLFGTGLAAGTATADALPLPRSAASAQILINGAPAPLFFVSPAQINFQLPFELEGQSRAEVRVAVLNAPSAPASLPLVPAAPGLFTASQNGQGTVIALHGNDSSPVNAQSPATAGEIVVIFGTGLGPVDARVASGEPSPAGPPARTRADPAVKLGGSAATVKFSGLAPGFVGLYQVNVEVPSGLPAGDAPLVVSLGGASSNTVRLPVR